MREMIIPKIPSWQIIKFDSRCWNKEMALKSLEFVTIIAVVVGRELPKEPDRGFRFNCWIDLCTFPLQYCDLDEQRCQYCSDDLCKSGSYPEQCKSYCSCKSYGVIIVWYFVVAVYSWCRHYLWLAIWSLHWSMLWIMHGKNGN